LKRERKDAAISDDFGLRAKEDEKVALKIAKSCKRSPNNKGSKEKTCIIGCSGIRNSSIEVETLVDKSIVLIQKSALLRSARMVRKILEM